MPHTLTRENAAVRAGGACLGVASFLMIAGLGLHGPIAPELEVQMTRIADASTAWSVAHWIAATALSLFVVAGLILLTSGSRLTDGPWTLTAWAVLPVGALWTLSTAVAEATAVAYAAESGSTEMFEAWWAFSEGYGTGFSFLALAVAVIAGGEARRRAGATPTWAAWSGAVAGVASFGGWALGMWFGVGVGNLVWLAASVVMMGWLLWFGITLARSRL